MSGLGGCWLSAAGNKRVEARDTARHLTVPRAAPQQSVAPRLRTPSQTRAVSGSSPNAPRSGKGCFAEEQALSVTAAVIGSAQRLKDTWVFRLLKSIGEQGI